MPFVALWLYKKDSPEGGDVGEMKHNNATVTNTSTALPNEDINDELDKSLIFYFLVCSFALWSMMNVAFFCTIDLSYANTLFGLKNAPQYTCERFVDSFRDDEIRWTVSFLNRMSYKKTISEDIRAWVFANIETWQAEKPDWFDIELIPDEFLPAKTFTSEGGANRRRRSSISFKELAAF